MIKAGVYLPLDYKINHLCHSFFEKFLTAQKNWSAPLCTKSYQNHLKIRIFDSERKHLTSKYPPMNDGEETHLLISYLV
jgi:hypothetical protein